MKPTITLSEINIHLQFLKDFIYDISICTSNIEQVVKSQKSGLFLKPIENFVGHYVFLCYMTCAITFYKIFGKDESRSFLKLFNQIENSQYDKELRNLISSNCDLGDSQLIKSKEELLTTIKDIRDEMDKKTELIKKINQRRSKVYAHTDKNAIQFKPETLNDLRELNDFTTLIYNRINGGLNGTHFMFDINIASINPVLSDREFVDQQYQNMEQNLDE